VQCSREWRLTAVGCTGCRAAGRLGPGLQEDLPAAVPCNAVQCSAVQCSAVQCSAVQCSAVCTVWTARGSAWYNIEPTAERFGVRECSGVNTVQCSTIQCSAVQCSAECYSAAAAAQCNRVQSAAVLLLQGAAALECSARLQVAQTRSGKQQRPVNPRPAWRTPITTVPSLSPSSIQEQIAEDSLEEGMAQSVYLHMVIKCDPLSIHSSLVMLFLGTTNWSDISDELARAIGIINNREHLKLGYLQNGPYF
jgi:hypothetical protein